jgi:ABC-type glycerol-3-phosphate transport system substrate-binding protein
MKKRILLLMTIVALMVAVAVAPASAAPLTASGDLFITMPMGGDHSMMMSSDQPMIMGGDHFTMMPMG